jgi:hypothetical protein
MWQALAWRHKQSKNRNIVGFCHGRICTRIISSGQSVGKYPTHAYRYAATTILRARPKPHECHEIQRVHMRDPAIQQLYSQLPALPNHEGFLACFAWPTLYIKLGGYLTAQFLPHVHTVLSTTTDDPGHEITRCHSQMQINWKEPSSRLHLVGGGGETYFYIPTIRPQIFLR